MSRLNPRGRRRENRALAKAQAPRIHVICAIRLKVDLWRHALTHALRKNGYQSSGLSTVTSGFGMHHARTPTVWIQGIHGQTSGTSCMRIHFSQRHYRSGVRQPYAVSVLNGPRLEDSTPSGHITRPRYAAATELPVAIRIGLMSPRLISQPE